jgi:ferredoxin-NADP reductase
MLAKSLNFRDFFRPIIAADVFDFWAGECRSLLTWQRPLARIVNRRVEAKNTVTLELKPNKHFLGFKAGQHINVTVEVNGVRLTRSYSLTNIPNNKGLLAITIKAVEHGKVSSYLCQQAQIGNIVEVSQAFGEMTLETTPSKPSVFLAAGSGITPLMSLIRHLTAVQLTQPLTLIYWAKTRAELCFVQDLRHLAANHANFHLYFALTNEAQLLAGELNRRPDAELLSHSIPNLESCQVFACGNAGFVESLRELIGKKAVLFQAESFTPLVLANVVSSTLGTVRVELKASQKTLELSAGQPLLNALEAQGIEVASGCRMGICNTCACSKLSGTTQDLNTGELTTEPQSALRLCVARANSDLILDL